MTTKHRASAAPSAELLRAVVLAPMTPLDLAKLVRKYELIAALRAGVGVVSAAQAREPLRALSREFPGALREVDVLSEAALLGRRAELNAAVEPYELWIRAVHAYHQTMALTLWLKGALSSREDDARFEELAAEASRRHGLSCAVAWVAAVASPPGGRLNRLVFDWLGAQFDLAAADVPALLFPRGNHSDSACSHEPAPPDTSAGRGERS